MSLQNKSDISSLDRKDIKIFYSIDCINEMFTSLNEEYKDKKIKVKRNNREVSKKRTVYMYFHNAKQFDSYIILNTKLKKPFKFKSLVKNQSGIL